MTARTTTTTTKRQKKKKVAVFIDGSNFYFKLRTLMPQKMDMLHYRYRELIESMLEPDEKISFIAYYIGVVRDDGKHRDNPKAQEMRKAQQKLFAQLGKQNFEIIRGYLLERDGKFFEKGVDVRLALDIVGRPYDKGMIISSDTDMIPAIIQAAAKKKEIMYIGFEHQPSLALIRYAKTSRLIRRAEALKFQAKVIKVRRYDSG